MIKRIWMAFILTFLALLAVACGGVNSGPSNPTPTLARNATPTTTSTLPSSPTAAPFMVTSIDMAVSPTSISSMACGTTLSVTYTATFHVTANSAGGTVQFSYTANNGRSSSNASITFAPGETTKSYSYTVSGTLNSDNVYPGLGGVITTNPNEVHSPMVKPTGVCVAGVAFQVTSIDLSVSPPSIEGTLCGSPITLVYTVTFHIAANGPGGTIQFMYTTNNGRSGTSASVSVAAGATTKTYTFTVSGTLYSDHTFPGIAEVLVSSPNQVSSPQVKPAGQCH